MAEILVKTLTRNRDPLSKYYMKDWTAFDICQIMPDGFFTKNKYQGAKRMGIVIRADGKIPQDYAGGVTENPNITYKNKSFTSPILSRSNLIIDLSKILTDRQLKDCFNHDLLVHPIYYPGSYIDLFEDRVNRTVLHKYDKSGSFDNETVDVGPNGNADANTFFEFESNLDATLTGPVVGDCDEECDETAQLYFNGTNANSTNYVVFKASGAGRHAGTWDDTKQNIHVASDIAVKVYDDGCRLEGLQIGKSAADATGENIIQVGANAAGADIRMSHCIIKDCADNTNYCIGLYVDDADVTAWVWNNLFYNFGTAVSSGNAGIYILNGTVKIYNNTIIGAYKGIVRGGGTVDIKNNLCHGQAASSYDGTFNAADYNGWTTTGSEGTNSIDLSGVADTDLFTAPGSDDYSLKVGTYVGTDLDGATPAVTDDIKNVARDASTPDIGAFEYAAAGGLSIPIAMHHYTKNIRSG